MKFLAVLIVLAALAFSLGAAVATAAPRFRACQGTASQGQVHDLRARIIRCSRARALMRTWTRHSRSGAFEGTLRGYRFTVRRFGDGAEGAWVTGRRGRRAVRFTVSA